MKRFREGQDVEVHTSVFQRRASHGWKKAKFIAVNITGSIMEDWYIVDIGGKRYLFDSNNIRHAKHL